MLSLTISEETGAPSSVTVTHTRRFLRAKPPTDGSGIVAWQVDHSTKGLLVDGAPFIPAGWFGSGGLHESVGLPAPVVVKAAQGTKSLSLDELYTLSMASVTTEWGRQGHTFVKAGFPPRGGDEDYEKDSRRLSMEYMDAAAAAGVYVLVDMSTDGLALAIAGQGKKNGGGPGVLTPRNVSEFRSWLLANISVYKVRQRTTAATATTSPILRSVFFYIYIIIYIYISALTRWLTMHLFHGRTIQR